MSNDRMNEFGKIRNLNLADLDENHNLNDSLNGDSNEEKKPSADQNTSVENARKEYKRPDGRYYEIDADITEAELRSFLLGHAYHQPLIILITIAAIVLPCVSLYRGNLTFMVVVLALIVIVYSPLSMCMQAKKIKKQNASFSDIFHYILDEEAFHLSIGEDSIDVEWKYFRKMMILKSIVVVYTGSKNGYVLPVKDMGGRKDEIVAFLKEKIGK